jgi:hypothetical protein
MQFSDRQKSNSVNKGAAIKKSKRMSSKNRLTLIIERDNGKCWGRATVKDNLLIVSATSLPTLERKMKKLLQEVEGLNDVQFDYAYDLTVFFEQYDFLNQSKIAAIAGLHPSLLRQYSTGHKLPSWEQVQKIEQAIRTLGKSMQTVRLSSKQLIKAR